MAALDRLASLGYARPLAAEALRQASLGGACPVTATPAPSAQRHRLWLLHCGAGAAPVLDCLWGYVATMSSSKSPHLISAAAPCTAMGTSRPLN